MRHSGRWMAAILITLGLGSAACTSAATTTGGHKDSPAKVEAIPGKDVKKVTLTERAAQRLDIRTVTIGTAQAAPPSGPSPSPGSPSPSPGSPSPSAGSPSPSPGRPATVVPYAAVLYDPNGGTWVYTVPQPLTYVREKVMVATVGGASGTEAVLSEAPPAGTTIVTTGVIELYGAELGVGK